MGFIQSVRCVSSSVSDDANAEVSGTLKTCSRGSGAKKIILAMAG